MNLTRREAVKTFAALPLAGLVLTETGCGATELTLLLGLIETTADSFIQVLAPQDTWAIMLGSLLTTAIDQTITELASSDSAATKFTNIAGYFAAIVGAQVPSGNKWTQLALDVIADVKNFLSFLNPKPALSAKAHKPWNGMLSKDDRKVLPMIRRANDVLVLKVKTLQR